MRLELRPMPGHLVLVHGHLLANALTRWYEIVIIKSTNVTHVLICCVQT